MSRAAEALALSQPAVSKALARLRTIFDDPLLVRDGRRMVLTPRAERLLGQVEKQCSNLEELWLEERFDTATSERTFKIAETDYEALAVLPEISMALKRDAPHVSLVFSAMLDGDHFDKWSEVDLVIAADEAIDLFATASVIKVPLLCDNFVKLLGLDHPMAKNTSMAAIPLRHLVYSPGADRLNVLAQKQPKPSTEPLATLPTFTVLPILALLTGTPAYAPRMVAERFAEFLPLKIIEGTGPRSPVTISMAWHQRWHEDGGHRWLRNLISAQYRQPQQFFQSP